MRHLAFFAMLAAFGPWAMAQRGGVAGGHGGLHAANTSAHVARRHAPTDHGGFASVRLGRSRFGRNGYGSPYDYISLPFPFFDDAYDSGDPYSTGYPVAAPLPPYLPAYGSGMRGDGDFAAQEMNSQARPSPLMIELKDGRYVQVSSSAVGSDAEPLGGEANSSSQIASGSSVANEASTLVPVALVFKDGHREQVRDYTIANGMLYARGDYYTDGYWDRKIDLSGLNVAETLQANAERGVKFVLPASPNEVVTRP